MRKLGILEYDFEPYATKYIGEIQQMIRELVDSGHAYVTRDGVYYRVSTFRNYGRLANRNVADLEAGARIEVDENKEDPLDFALWKFAKPGEPRWPFEPYGDGRPGWHIECSAMARALLDPPGVGFDIHGGGADLIFPHHENEIAQSEPLMAQPPMANFWVHGGLLLFDNRKMAKSLGNFEPLSDMLQRHDPQAIRWLFLQTGYRKVMNFTEDSIAAAALGLSKIKTAYRSLALGAKRRRPRQRANARHSTRSMEAALDDDMNTAAALAVLYEAFAAHRAARTPALLADDSRHRAKRFVGRGTRRRTDAAASSNACKRALDGDGAAGEIENLQPHEAIERVIAMRAEARASKGLGGLRSPTRCPARSGIELHDTKEGTTWTTS